MLVAVVEHTKAKINNDQSHIPQTNQWNSFDTSTKQVKVPASSSPIAAIEKKMYNLYSTTKIP
jgi:hypothetical protein